MKDWIEFASLKNFERFQKFKNILLPRCRIELVSSNAFKIDFVGNTISGLAAYFFFIILKFIFTPIFEIKISDKYPCHENNFIFLGQFS